MKQTQLDSYFPHTAGCFIVEVPREERSAVSEEEEEEEESQPESIDQEFVANLQDVSQYATLPEEMEGVHLQDTTFSAPVGLSPDSLKFVTQPIRNNDNEVGNHPFNYFQIVHPLHYYEQLAASTNSYARQLEAEMQASNGNTQPHLSHTHLHFHKKLRHFKFQQVTWCDIVLFHALLIYMSTVKLQNKKSYWSNCNTMWADHIARQILTKYTTHTHTHTHTHMYVHIHMQTLFSLDLRDKFDYLWRCFDCMPAEGTPGGANPASKVK